MKEKILRAIKAYSSRPYYVLRLGAEACQYTVLLNGIPVTTLATRGGVSNEVPLNNYILKTGRQALSVEIRSVLPNKPLQPPASFSAEVGFSLVQGAKALGSYTRVAGVALGPQQKSTGLPTTTLETAFEAKVPWDYSAMLGGAAKLPAGATLDALLARAVGRLHTAIAQRAVTQYQAILVDSVAKESDVLFRTPAEVDFIVAHSDLSDVKQLAPVPSYTPRLFAAGKIVQAVSDTADEYGNRSVIRYSIPSLRADGPDGQGTEDYLYYLPRGASELHIF